ncbi:chalcone isomerase family protein [Sediminitomix flava]|uniref:Chalcone isomerase-like protein n=1 Tax=Sediminitomix flava TaxID=379075 RepID=A0A315ZBT0_SEDFL|nr:chalcone isomerase family protein [Sediminitomix flava]PWJ42820.1 chalcone isomerase-like protein [Sediminitomix flava]
MNLSKRLSTLVALLFIAITSSFAQTEIAGVELPNSIQVDGKDVTLNGGGIRSKYFMDLYVGGLYLEAKSKDAQAIVTDNAPMAIRLEIVSGLITSDKMASATTDGFKSSLNGNTAPLQTEIDQFVDVFKKDEIVKKDIFEFKYQPSAEKTLVYKNGKELLAIKGLAFKKALFGIWLSNKPADKDLKSGMLGKN